MMTKLEERSRIKCDQYWPGRGAETYGLMHVLLVDVAELATYTIRTFHIQRVCFKCLKHKANEYIFSHYLRIKECSYTCIY